MADSPMQVAVDGSVAQQKAGDFIAAVANGHVQGRGIFPNSSVFQQIFHERIVPAHDGEVKNVGLSPRPGKRFKRDAMPLENVQHLGMTEKRGHAPGGMERRKVSDAPPSGDMTKEEGVGCEPS